MPMYVDGYYPERVGMFEIKKMLLGGKGGLAKPRSRFWVAARVNVIPLNSFGKFTQFRGMNQPLT